MLVPAPSFAPSRKLVAFAFEQRDFRVIPPRKHSSDEWVAITMPALVTGRKEGQTLIYAAKASLWTQRAKFPFAEDGYTVDDFARALTYSPNVYAGQTEKGEFFTLSPQRATHVADLLELLAEAFATPSHLPAGYLGWFGKA